MFSTSNGTYGNWGSNPNTYQRSYANQPSYSNQNNIVTNYEPPNYYNQHQYQQRQQNPQFLGLTNMGNTCYINSILQAIFDVLTLEATSSYNQPITYLYTKLQQTHDNRDYHQFKRYLGGQLQYAAGHQQQDAHEFLTGLLQILNRQNQQAIGGKPNFKIDKTKQIAYNWGQFCYQMRKTDNSKIIDIFGGELYTELRCYRNHSQYLFERFLNVSISIPSSSFKVFHLQRLLVQNYKQQTLEGVTCDSCHQKTRKNKKSVIYKPPVVFVIHLKRFEQGFWSNNKINTPIAFNQVLDLKSQYIHPDTITLNEIYDLYAVVHHVGTMNGGHYYTQKKVGNKWLTYNDTQVTQSQMKKVDNVSDTAYILFYRRR